MEIPVEKIRIVTGVLTPFAALTVFGVSAMLSPTYSWPGEPFSVMGGGDGLGALFFNAGLIVTGLLAIPFATLLWRTSGTSEGLLFGVIGLGFAGAGAFPMEGGPHSEEFAMNGSSIAHELFGAAIFLGISLYLLVAGVKRLRAGTSRDGWTAVGLGLITVLVWLPWDLGLQWAWIGWGGAEGVVVGAFGLWCAVAASRLWSSRGTPIAGEGVETHAGA